mmetsp:Transcript_26278/g.49039  ORF Transcript_26278/g.49039 Transcript_26278/m.49039 type:complete len:179 (-) Transcript_26278:1203-1739(-)
MISAQSLLKTMLLLLVGLAACCATAESAAKEKFQVSAESAQWYYDEVFDPFNGQAALAKDPKSTEKYAAFYAEDAVLCEPNGYGLCLHGRDAIARGHVLPFNSIKCHALHPTTNADHNSITTEWVCATDWGEGCMSALRGFYYMEFNDDGLIAKKIASIHPGDPVPPACFQPPTNEEL